MQKMHNTLAQIHTHTDTQQHRNKINNHIMHILHAEREREQQRRRAQIDFNMILPIPLMCNKIISILHSTFLELFHRPAVDVFMFL